MLFEIDDEFTELRPLGFEDFGTNDQREKQLENLIARTLHNVLYEGESLLPIYQEVSFEAVGDIYALNRQGDLAIFELKRSWVSGDALSQVLRYAQQSGKWDYGKLNDKFQKYRATQTASEFFDESDLKLYHRDQFGLKEPLPESDFNKRRHCYIIGSAADQQLIEGVSYWQQEGLSIDYVPYRLYEIGGKKYFEFFSKPFDIHGNPNHRKGCIFDTCARFYPDNLKWMVEKSRVSAFGEQRHVMGWLNRNDYVFLSHRGHGVVAAARITGSRMRVDEECDGKELEHFWDVEFLTPPPSDFASPDKFLSFSDVSELLDQNFFWARTIKTPYLSIEQSEKLLDKLDASLRRQPIEIDEQQT